jgi:hypothetical protein
MVQFRIGERVSLRGETFVIVGLSPVSVVPRVVHLEHPDTGEPVDADAHELTPATRSDDEQLRR